MLYEKEMKSIKFLQNRSSQIEESHKYISREIEEIKKCLDDIQDDEKIRIADEYEETRQKYISDMSKTTPLQRTNIQSIYEEAELQFPDRIKISDILSVEDFCEADKRIGQHIQQFNAKYNLDGWDYAIAGGCGLFAAMLDLLCVSMPLRPTASVETKVNGIFNQGVQKAFNKFLPPDFSKVLSERFPIGGPDASTSSDLIGAPSKAINPINHRLRSLAHDPILGVIFGVRDMLKGTCTIVKDGQILTIPSTGGPLDGNIFQLIGRMLGHLVSDVNAPSMKMNRGMGLPAPFMGFLRMIENIPVGDSNFGRQIEWMYVNGYDFRQFITTSIPMSIMEVLLRVFYVGKQIKIYDAAFGETIMDTMPGNLNPRFRIMLALAYGTSSAVNYGKIYVTGNILNANYASWMGLVWNGFHALKWSLFSKHLALWQHVEQKEIEELEEYLGRIEELEQRAENLPI